jgi:hypothetical protein
MAALSSLAFAAILTAVASVLLRRSG